MRQNRLHSEAVEAHELAPEPIDRSNLPSRQALAEQDTVADRLVCDHRRTGPESDRCGIGNMVEMCVADGDQIGPGHLLGRQADVPAERPVISRVQQNHLAAVDEFEACATQPPQRDDVAVSRCRTAGRGGNQIVAVT